MTSSPVDGDDEGLVPCAVVRLRHELVTPSGARFKRGAIVRVPVGRAHALLRCGFAVDLGVRLEGAPFDWLEGAGRPDER